jgi:N-acetylglucosamine PTS system EIICBA or EIICB component
MVIVRFDLHTPGRDPGDGESPAIASPAAPLARAHAWLAALGGPGNLKSVDAGTTPAAAAAAAAAALQRTLSEA